MTTFRHIWLLSFWLSCKIFEPNISPGASIRGPIPIISPRGAYIWGGLYRGSNASCSVALLNARATVLPQHYAQSRSFFFSITERENDFFQMNRSQEGDKLESQTFFHSIALGPKKIPTLQHFEIFAPVLR